MTPQFDDPLPIEGDYFKWLRTIEPESLRKAWLDGDFHALQGIYFSSFRSERKAYEPEHAWHVYSNDPQSPHYEKVEPWWQTWMSMDWGYIHPAVFQYHTKSPQGRILTFREVAMNRVEPYELGVIMAHDAKPILERTDSKVMTLYMSPDAYAREHGEETEASQIAAGIGHILGPRSVFLMDFDEAERAMKVEDAYQSMMGRKESQKSTRFVITRANTHRVPGFMHLQTLLRFKPLDQQSTPDLEYADKLYEQFGIVAQRDYLNLPEFKISPEVLPRCRVHESCSLLIRCLGMAMHKPGTNDVAKWNATESKIGDDSLDCWRYGLYSESKHEAGTPPIEQRVEQRMRMFQSSGYSDGSRFMARQRAYEIESGQHLGKQQYTGYNRFAVVRSLRRKQAAEDIRKMSGRN